MRKTPTAGERMIESAKQALAFVEGKEKHSPAAVVHTVRPSGRPITEILAEARRRNSTDVLDENFSKDIEEIIASHQATNRSRRKA